MLLFLISGREYLLCDFFIINSFMLNMLCANKFNYWTLGGKCKKLKSTRLDKNGVFCLTDSQNSLKDQALGLSNRPNLQQVLETSLTKKHECR